MTEKELNKVEQEALQRYIELVQARKERQETKGSAGVMAARTSIVAARDRLSMERIIGKSDLLPVSYLEAGVAAAKSVCRIVIRNSSGEVEGYGTGFLVSPTLLLTNNHVLETPEAAKYAVAEFNFEDDRHFVPRENVNFRFVPDELFLTDIELDFTLVAVEETNGDGKQLAEFGYLPLLPMPGKILEGEYVTIIQHPKGGPKAVAIRENEVRFLSPDFVHYVSDTEAGSSGSPVFNDQWVVVALHHAAVPHPGGGNSWIANEGIRISSILRRLEQLRESVDEVRFHKLLDKLLNTETKTMEVGVLEEEWYSGVTGYDPLFLGEEYGVPLPILSGGLEQDVARTAEGKDVLDYTHFSIAMSKSRRLAFYTAVNIDGSQLVDVKRGNDRWYYDPRINEEFQIGPDFYKSNDIDRGHLVRRQDPNWGMDAVKANAHTFHFTNCAPQHKNFNQKTWLDLEDYLLENAGSHGIKVSIFTGPVFKEDDVVYRGCQVPAEFWKVAVIVKEDGTLSATAYLQSQAELVSDLEFTYGRFQTYQVSVERIEELTCLDFGELKTWDPLAGQAAVAISGKESLRL